MTKSSREGIFSEIGSRVSPSSAAPLFHLISPFFAAILVRQKMEQIKKWCIFKKINAPMTGISLLFSILLFSARTIALQVARLSPPPKQNSVSREHTARSGRWATKPHKPQTSHQTCGNYKRRKIGVRLCVFGRKKSRGHVAVHYHIEPTKRVNICQNTTTRSETDRSGGWPGASAGNPKLKTQRAGSSARVRLDEKHFKAIMPITRKAPPSPHVADKPPQPRSERIAGL